MGVKLGLHQQRGRRVLLWAAALYCLANLAVVGVIDSSRKELRSPYLADVFHQLRRCPAGKPDVVCIGTSRLSMAFSATQAQGLMRSLTEERDLEVFNAATGAQDLIAADFIMEHMLARGARPSLAVIEICPDLLARRDIWLGQHVMPPAPTIGNLDIYLGDLRRAPFDPSCIIANRLYPLSRCRRELWTALGDLLADRYNLDLRPAEHDEFGRRACAGQLFTAAALPGQRDHAYQIALDANQVQERKAHLAEGLRTQRDWLENYEVGGLTCESLERLLERCAQHHVRVLLVAPPVTSEQRALYTPQIETLYQDCLQQYHRKYGCRYVDCRDQLPDACFYDNHHVRIPDGSAPFCQRLTQEVLAPEWQAMRASVYAARQK